MNKTVDDEEADERPAQDSNLLGGFIVVQTFAPRCYAEEPPQTELWPSEYTFTAMEGGWSVPRYAKPDSIIALCGDAAGSVLKWTATVTLFVSKWERALGYEAADNGGQSAAEPCVRIVFDPELTTDHSTCL